MIFRLFILSIIGLFICFIYKKHKSRLDSLFNRFFKLFSKKKGENETKIDIYSKNKYRLNTNLNEEIRKDIIYNQYLFMMEERIPICDTNKKSNDTKIEAEREAITTSDSKQPGEADQKISESTLLIDKNGEGHTLYDLATAPVNQKTDSSFNFSAANNLAKRKLYKTKEHVRIKAKQKDATKNKPKIKNKSKTQFKDITAANKVSREDNKKHKGYEASQLNNNAILAALKNRLTEVNRANHR